MLSITPDMGTKNATVKAVARGRAMVAKQSASAVREAAGAARGAAMRSAAALATLLEPPVTDAAVIAGEKYVRHGVAAPVERARVVGVLRCALERVAERLLDHAVFVPERSGQLTHHRVYHHHRGQLAPRQYVRADGDHIRREVLVHALVEALVAATQERERGLSGELACKRVVEPAAARRERDRPVWRGRLAVALPQCGLHHVHAD